MLVQLANVVETLLDRVDLTNVRIWLDSENGLGKAGVREVGIKFA
jgi:hypothetical protein